MLDLASPGTSLALIDLASAASDVIADRALRKPFCGGGQGSRYLQLDPSKTVTWSVELLCGLMRTKFRLLTSRFMRQLASDIWVAEAPLRFLGLQVGARMTVMRLPGAKLLLHSPIAAANELVREVEALGTVAYIVAPNRFHHLFVSDWQLAFPHAKIYVAPGLETKRADLEIAGVLSDQAEAAWERTVDQVLVAGIPSTNEVVFFHRPSATLIATDLAFNIRATSAPVTRLAFRMGGTYGRLSPSIFERLLVRDRAAFRRSLSRILEWPFERVVVAHGEVSEKDGKEDLARGYAWLLQA